MEEKLGESYEKDLHFIGHSYGTVVSGIATRYLESTHTLDNDDIDIQFTTLDSPTDAPLNTAPDLNKDWFYNNLSSKVDYMDNYYGEDIDAFGEPISGAAINQLVDRNHSNVAKKFYPDLVVNGPKANTNAAGFDTGDFAHQFKDWITPVLPINYSDRPNSNEKITVGVNDYWITSIDYRRFNAAINTADTVVKNHGDYVLAGLYFEEHSPVSIYYSLDVPLGTEWFYFDWMILNGGDGDWITVHFGSDLL